MSVSGFATLAFAEDGSLVAGGKFTESITLGGTAYDSAGDSPFVLRWALPLLGALDTDLRVSALRLLISETQHLMGWGHTLLSNPCRRSQAVLDPQCKNQVKNHFESCL